MAPVGDVLASRLETPALSDSDRIAILGGNAAALFDIPV